MNIVVIKKLQRITIIVIVILLALVLVMGSIYAYQNFLKPKENSTVVLPDNVLAGTEDSSLENANNNRTMDTVTSSVSEKTTAIKIELFKTASINNEPFNMRNIIPGSSEKKNFAVKIFHEEDVILNFAIRDSENDIDSILSSGLRAKVIDLSSNKELLDDAIENIKEKSFSINIPKNPKKETERYYEVFVYLPTKAGNEFQRIAYNGDFIWSVYGKLSDIKPPKTGDDINRILIPVLFLSISLIFLIILLILKRKDKTKNEYKK